jgi:hypothetical protein
MKKLPFLIAVFLLFLVTTQAKNQRKGRGAAKVQELGQAVFSALQQNQFNNLHNYLPEENELKILKRRSSEDMRLVLEKTTRDSIRENLQRDFTVINEKATENTINWSEWQPTDTKATRRDRKNPLLFRTEMTLTHASGAESSVLFEAVRIRNRYFLFKQMILEPKK